MPRAVWSGSLSFGLVNIPVKAFTAVHDHTIHFHQLHKGTGARIRNKRVSAKSGREVDSDQIELGHELSSGRYVTVDPEEIDALRPKTTRTIDITDFVALDEIDPIYYERTYWLAPADDTANRPYQLLLAVMDDQQRVGIGRIVMHRKQCLGAIRPYDRALALSTMRFADEVVDRSDIDALPERRTKPSSDELDLATTVVDALASAWDPKRYHDDDMEQVRDIIERRAAGKTVEPEESPEPSGGEVVDLMAALEASVAEARTGRTSKRSTKRSSKRSTKRSTKASARASTKASDGRRAKRTA
jgi:DNA end-binding protein Ku